MHGYRQYWRVRWAVFAEWGGVLAVRADQLERLIARDCASYEEGR